MPQNASAYPTDSTLPTQPAAQVITRHLLVVMGVCGSGKSTVAEGLHNELGWPWLDADSLHAPSSIEKMAHGIPLTDEDRQGWLTRCHAWLAEKQKVGTGGILACSALRRTYRDQLRQDGVKPLFIYLSADTSVLAQRLKTRPDHFMPASLLPSQIQTLEPPQADEQALTFSVLPEPAEVIAEILTRLRTLPSNM